MPKPAGAPELDEPTRRVLKELDGLFDELDDLLKNEEVQLVLGKLKVNSSIALLAADGLRAYLKGDKETAMEDLSTAAEEIAQRFAQSAKGDA
jgi:CHASE3 domain sensor protein